MTKSKRIRNKKLRKQIMRTASALTMTMAVALAAIPVENLGTVQADATPQVSEVYENLKDEYTRYFGSAEYNALKDTTSTNKSTYEDAYSGGTDVTLSRISGSGDSIVLKDIFSAKKVNGDACITDYIGSGTADGLNIQELEYYDYVYMDSNYLEKFDDVLGAGSDYESYTVTYSLGSTKVTIPGPTYVTGQNPDTGADITEKADDIDIYYIGTDNLKYRASNLKSGTLSSVTNNKYLTVNAPTTTTDTENMVKGLYECALGELTDDIIKNYNTAVDNYVAYLKGAGQPKTLSDWNTLKSTLSNTNGGLLTSNELITYGRGLNLDGLTVNSSVSTVSVTKTYNDVKDVDSEKVHDYMICYRMSAANNDRLKPYQLVKVTHTSNSQNDTVYVPKLKDGGTRDSSAQYLDDKNYLVGGDPVTIRGIGSKAMSSAKDGMKDKITGTVTIPSTVEFIGSEAFRGQPISVVNLDNSRCKIIGDYAFAECGNLSQFNFTLTSSSSSSDSSMLKTIGNYAFYKTTNLDSIIIPNSVMTIGAACFEESGLTSVSFVDSADGISIGPFAFYNCEYLERVSWNDKRKVVIGEAAFAVGENNSGYVYDNVMDTFEFPSGNEIINDYILAGRTNLKKVVMPSTLKYKETNSNGNKMGDSIPINTLAGCTNLGVLEFPDLAGDAGYDTQQLFRYITNPNFYVRGPMRSPSDPNNSESRATTRTTTWQACYGNDTSNAVPYNYTDDNGIECWEYGVIDEKTKTAPFIASVSVPNGKDNAILNSFISNSNVTTSLTEKQAISIGTISDEVTITTIGNGIDSIFPGDMKNWIYEVEIEEGVQTISDHAFEDSVLEWVYIANSVTSIGADAFKNCKLLENVTFECGDAMYTYPSSNSAWTNLQIEPTAFNTGSEYLTFHGPVSSNYAPFQLAMRKGNYSPENLPDDVDTETLTKATEICYKMDSPYNLIIIRDAATSGSNAGKATLIDYPHYEDLDTTTFENTQLTISGGSDTVDTAETDSSVENSTDVAATDVSGGTTSNSQVVIQNDAVPLADAVDVSTTANTSTDVSDVVQAINLWVPDGVESVDTVAYFSTNYNSNSNNIAYMNYNYGKGSSFGKNDRIYTQVLRTRGVNDNTTYTNIQNLYSDVNYDPRTTDEKNETNQKSKTLLVPGLFSGWFMENSLVSLLGQNYDGHYFLNEGYEYRSKTTNPGGKVVYDNGYYICAVGGNDALRKITLTSVERLPDYAFYSCDNLTDFEAGSALTDFGVLPFKNAKSIMNITLPDDSKYESSNQLLFEKTGDGDSLKLIECLETRGKGETGYASNWISESELAGVSELADGAFSDCTYLNKVELQKSSITTVPSNAFDNCSQLTAVELPSTTYQIQADSFLNLGNGTLDVKIPNEDCFIDTKAFDGDTNVLFRGVKYSDETNKVPSVTYVAFQNLEKYYGEAYDESGDDEGTFQFKDVGHTYRVVFVDDELKTIDPDGVVYVECSSDTNYQDYVPETKIPTAPVKTGKRPTGHWMYKDPVSGDVLMDEDAYTGIKEDRMLVALYEADPSQIASDGNEYLLTVENGQITIDGKLQTSSSVMVKSGTTTIGIIAADMTKFKTWTTDPTTDIALVGDTSSFATNFTMPCHNVTVTANDALDGDGTSSGDNNGGTSGDGTGSGGNNGGTSGDGTSSGGTSGDGTSSGDTSTKYNVVVNYGSGSGSYAAGDVVSISAYAPTSSTKVFSKWTSNNSSIGFADASLATTTFVMPASDVTVTANYKTRSDDDDDTVSSRPGTSTSTTTVSSRPSDSTTTTTTSTVTNGNGNKIVISNNGVSNKDVASVSVEGSTDNFIVKISETDEANEMAKQALTNAYGSLDNIAYFPMDVSLYDSTGQNKITNTNGLNITVTMPIPDNLIQYGGNARVAATDNGNLQQITPKFTTIDGIACISFVPPHFSPYVIYVDKSNLIAGQMYDSTPATGDPIHPKWFAVIGMACLSVLLFAGSTPRRRRRYRTA